MKLSTVWLDGLWDRNPGLIQLLGLCPLLAVSNTLENAIGLGLATLFVLVLSNASISLIRTLVDDAIRLPHLRLGHCCPDDVCRTFGAGTGLPTVSIARDFSALDCHQLPDSWPR